MLCVSHSQEYSELSKDSWAEKQTKEDYHSIIWEQIRDSGLQELIILPISAREINSIGTLTVECYD